MEKLKIKSLRNLQAKKLQNHGDFLRRTHGKNADQMNLRRSYLPKREKPTTPKSHFRQLLSKLSVLLCVFLVGGMGGIFLDRFFLPYVLASFPVLARYETLKPLNERTLIIRETEEVKITADDAAPRAIEKASQSAVSIEIQNASGAMVKTGSGVILTNDGYILTARRNLNLPDTPIGTPTTQTPFNVKLQNNALFPGNLVAETPKYGLAIIKVAANNLATIPYADRNSLKLGQTLVMMDSGIQTDLISQFLSDYIQPSSPDASHQERLRLSRKLDPAYAGAAVINLKGELVGIFQSDDLVIPLGEISDFINSSLKQ